jgi:hypothetical protein
MVCQSAAVWNVQVLNALGIAHSGSGTLSEAATPAFVTRGGYKARDLR